MSRTLRITSNGRFLAWDDGTPFFLLADTAWEIFHRLSLDEARHYLETRAQQEFTVVMGVALAEFDGLGEPNRNGDLPLHDQDPTRPNEKYFAHVDAVLDVAEQLGLFFGLLPTWGDKVNKAWGVGPQVLTPENARVYGEFLGRRYAARERLIWINGGDRVMETPAQKDAFRNLAAGLRAGDGGRHLITFHPQGGHSSSEDFHAESWLDFNMIQSGHGARGNDNAALVDKDLAHMPPKPTLDAEPNYENHAINWKADTSRFRDSDVRIASYRSVFAGACGVAYGCQDVWQFFDSSRHAAIAYADTPWQEALQFSGAWQMRHLKTLLTSRPFITGKPAQSRLISGGERVRVTTGDGYLLAYAPEGETVTLDLDGLGFDGARIGWFDPRTGLTLPAGEAAVRGKARFAPPTSGRHNDWVLCLDKAQ
jgi:hypothetical protein